MARLRSLVVVLLVLTVAGTCVRLGFWQVGRWREKTAANRLLAAALAAPPRPLPADRGTGGPGRWSVAGRFDPARSIVLVGRSLDGGPGVHLVGALQRDDGGPAVLVDRGFVPSPDAATARPADFPEPAPRTVVGLVEPLARRPGDPLWARATQDSTTVWSARWIDPDSLAAAWPYPVAPVLLRELPGEGVPARPERSAARLVDTSAHLSYAGQWFFFALVTIIGPFFLARARRRRGGTT